MLTRRRLLGSAAASGLAIYAADARLVAQAATRRRAPLATGGAFEHGVLSGDPTHRAATLWTRVSQLEQDAVRVRLEIARDAGFRRVLVRKDVPTARSRDHTVKVRVGGLKPDERYFYRFSTRGAHSPVGRVQTAPHPDSDRPVRIAFFSCQAYTAGHFGAYRALLETDPDVVVCLGDYIYERTFSGYDLGAGREDKVGANGDGEVKTLDEYRAKYRLYRSDPDLQALHRDVPFVAMWDDHEVEDNYVGGDPSSDDYDRPRQLSGWRAFFEYQPTLEFFEANRTYRRLRYGRAAELLLTDQRSYRDEQPCGDAFLAPCGESGAPRDYLGPVQHEWLRERLAASTAHWKLIGNQLMIMPFDATPAPASVPVLQDSWEGYQKERNELLSFIRRREIQDVVFLTGDIHTFFAGEVRERGRTGPAVATELVGGSTTSPGTAEVVSETTGNAVPPNLVAALADKELLIANPWMKFVDSRTHGFATLEVSRREVLARFHGSRDVTTREGSADVRQLTRLRIGRATPRIESP